MLKPCKHSNCAVCKSIQERKIFESIFKKLNPELYICEHAIYKITNLRGEEFLLASLEHVCRGTQKYYVHDMFTSAIIYLGRGNFKVLCSKDEEDCEPYVTEYI